MRSAASGVCCAAALGCAAAPRRGLPGFVTRFVVRWAPANEPQTAYPFAPGDCPSFPCATATHGYVWHCHIIDHEDNEMMRPDVIQIDAAASRTFVRGIDY